MVFCLMWGLLAAGLSVGFGFVFLRWFQMFVRSAVREYVTELHQAKDQTPTMGGIFFIAAFVITTLLLAPWSDLRMWALLLATVGFALIGFWDDRLKITRKLGITERQKWYAQCAVALCTLLLWYFGAAPDTVIHIPIFSYLNFKMGWLLIPWGVWILLSTTNGVNLTDGLDGLAASLVAINCAVFGVIAWMAGDILLACMACAFACSLLGFLWFNAFPAQVFMGDVGSLACGGFLGLLVLMTRWELLLPIVGAIFVLEVLSVMLQVFVLKRFGYRIFKMAPMHHHFELIGVPETKITARFILITLVLGMVALALAQLG